MTDSEFLCLPVLVDLTSLRSRISELRNVSEDSILCSEDSEKLLNEISVELEKKRVGQVASEYSATINSLTNEDLDELSKQLKEELNAVVVENMNVEHEIAELSKRWVDEYAMLESESEKLTCAIQFFESQSLVNREKDMEENAPYHFFADSETISNTDKDSFEMLELSSRIKKLTTTLESLQDLDLIIQSMEAVQKIEEVWSGFGVVKFEGNSIRLSLKTLIPNIENVPWHQEIEGVTEPLELNHELIIEMLNGTLELNSVEIFPNDVYIGEIVEGARSLRMINPLLSLHDVGSSFEWFARSVRDRIALSSLRRVLVRHASNSRHSFEYLDKENAVVAHLAGGIDAFIKLSPGWPLMNSPLKLISLKSTRLQMKEISLSFLCGIVDAANMLKESIRQNILAFVGQIEEILVKQTTAKLTD